MARGQVELLYVFQVRTHCTGHIVITTSQPRPTAPRPVPANLNAARSGAQVPAGCAPHSTWWAVCTLDLARACACVIEFARGLTQSCISRCICRYRISFRLLQVRHRQDTPDPVLYCTCTLSYADSSSIDQPPLHMHRARPMPTLSPTSLPREARARASERGRCVMPAASPCAHICDGEHVPACRGCAGGSQSIQIDFCDLQGSDDASAPDRHSLTSRRARRRAHPAFRIPDRHIRRLSAYVALRTRSAAGTREPGPHSIFPRLKQRPACPESRRSRVGSQAGLHGDNVLTDSAATVETCDRYGVGGRGAWSWRLGRSWAGTSRLCVGGVLGL